VSPLLEALGDAPGDVLRVIIGYVEEKYTLKQSSRENDEELEGERTSTAGRKRGREE